MDNIGGKENQHGDEITLKELILKLQEYFREVIRSWSILIIISLITVGLSLYQHYTHVLTYKANTRFIVEGQTGNTGGLSSLLGKIGMGSSKGVNPFKILEVAYGSEFLETLLNTKGKEGEYVSNMLLDIYELPKEWSKIHPKYEEFRFSGPIDISNAEEIDNRVVRKLHKLIWGSESDRSKALCKISFDLDSGLYDINSNTESEALSFLLTNTIYQELKVFFEEELWSNQIQLAAILNAKADSLQAVRDFKVRELARFENRNRAIIGKELTAERSIILMEQSAINNAYAEVLKTREMTDVNMKDKKPLFVTVDVPYLPLSPVGSSLKKKIIFGLAVGIFLSVLFILTRKIYKDVMSS